MPARSADVPLKPGCSTLDVEFDFSLSEGEFGVILMVVHIESEINVKYVVKLFLA